MSKNSTKVDTITAIGLEIVLKGMLDDGTITIKDLEDYENFRRLR